ncbi:hypothetical protein MMC12_000380 [Toensbergia leucococca]|nr:hypothetical protein [Toensbergia leucococca]
MEPFRSRRSLHSAFWCHGAGSIDLPSWWISLLEVPSAENPPRASSGRHTTLRSLPSSILEGRFLDFLYPTQTLALIQRFVLKDVLYPKSRRQKRRVQQESRAYISTAAGDELESGSHHHLAAAALQPETDNLALSEDEKKPPMLSRQLLESLNQVLISKNTRTEYNLVWQKYRSLQKLSGHLSEHQTTRLLNYLGSSDRQVDSKRSRLLFDTIAVEKRRGIHYSRAIAAALRQKNLKRAIMLHREGLAKTGGYLGLSAILLYSITHGKLLSATEVFITYKTAGMKILRWPDIWSEVNFLPKAQLIDAALLATSLVLKNQKASGADAAPDVRKFVLNLSLRALNVKGASFDPIAYQKLFQRRKLLEMPTLTMYANAIYRVLSLDRSRYGNVANAIYRDLTEETQLVPSHALMNAILRWCCETQSEDDQRKLLDDYRRYHQRPNKVAYLLFMTAFARQGNAEAVHGLAQESVAHFGNPDTSHIYHVLLYVHFRRAEVEQAVQTFHRLKDDFDADRMVHSWNIVLATFTRVGDVDGALSWFSQILESDCKPNAVTFNTMMTMYADRGDLDAVEDMLQQCKAQGIGRTMGMMTALVLALIRNNRLDDAQRKIREAMQEGLRGTATEMWNHILNAYAMRGDLERVSKLQRQMKKAEVPFDNKTWNVLLHALCIRRQARAASRVLDSILPRENVRVNSLHYATVMSGYLSTHEYDKVMLLYRRMIERGIKPSMSTENLLNRAAVRHDGRRLESEGRDGEALAFQRADELLEQTVANISLMELAPQQPLTGFGIQRLDEGFPSVYFTELIAHYGREGSFEKVAQLYEQYIATSKKLWPNADISPPVPMLTALMVAHYHQEDYREVEACWHLVLQKTEQLVRPANASDLSQGGWVLPSRRWILNKPLKLYIRALSALGRIDEVSVMVEDLYFSGYGLNSQSWNVYVECLARNNRALEAFQFCEKQLIADWPGWAVHGKKNIEAKIDRLQPGRRQPELRMVNYRTIVSLAAAYVEVESGKMDNERRTGLSRLRRVAPKTVGVVTSMPQINDSVQDMMLRRV